MRFILTRAGQLVDSFTSAEALNDRLALVRDRNPGQLAEHAVTSYDAGTGRYVRTSPVGACGRVLTAA